MNPASASRSSNSWQSPVLQSECLQFGHARRSFLPFVVAQEAGRLICGRVVFDVHGLQRPQAGTVLPVPHGLVSGCGLGHGHVDYRASAWHERVTKAGQGLQRRLAAVEERDRPRRDDHCFVGRQLDEGCHVGLSQDRVEAAVTAVLAAGCEHLR